MSFDNFEEAFQHLVPTLGALSVASVIVIVSLTLKKTKKVIFQFFAFGVILAACIAYLANNADKTKLTAAWRAFVDLPNEVRFALSLGAIIISYFGGAMYVAPEESRSPTTSAKAIFATPASCDTVIRFEEPQGYPEDDLKFFEKFLDKLQAEIVADVKNIYEMTDEAVNWVDNMITYTVAGGKMNRGLTVLQAYKKLVKSPQITMKEKCQASALGWAIEFLQAFFLVADDLMDGSITRRGSPCWYLKDDVKLIAINDSFLLESFVYKIIKKYVGNEKYYYQVVDLFLEVTRQTEFGQLLDLTSQPHSGELDLSRYTIERYFKIVRYKTAFYSFYIPIALAMIMAGITSQELFQQAKDILLIMGEYFQIQDDYLDCYGDPKVIGKIGTDIEDKKCSWLVVQALNRATPEQRRVLQDNYGEKDVTKVQRIKALYREMQLEELFKTYEEKSYKSIISLLDKVEGMDKTVFKDLLAKIYKRSK